MFYQTESKLQGWRAVAVYEGGGECLLFVGRSTTHVRAGYVTAFAEVLDAEERARVRRIALESWQGAADQGRWVAKAALAVPGQGAARPSAPADSHPALLAFGAPAGPAAGPQEPLRKAIGA
jgi:hypothetical protein